MVEEKPKNLGLSGQISSPTKYTPPSEMPIPSEALKETDKVKKELEDFKKKVIKKFPFTISLSILPAHSFKLFEEDEGLLPEEIKRKPLHLIFIIPEDEFKNISKKIKPEIIKLIQETKQNLWVHIKTPVDVWNYGLDSKFEFIDAIGGSFPLYDKGLLGSLRVATIHKSLVLRKFEKYVASYIIGGSLVRGTADKDSDVDTFIIIDDTDVKRMPRLQLLEKLRGIIYDYIREATALSGVKNILNVQVYLLTDFWDNVKDANPVMFTFIRDGIPMYDRGTFLPWKLLLQMGKIKPSPESIDKFMKYGEQNESLVNRRLIDAMIDIYWGVITPTQALMMLAGHAPPTPKTIVQDVKKLFVDKEKIMGLRELKILEKVVKLYKDYEHGKLKRIPGKDVDLILKEANEYDKKLKEIRKKLEGRLIEHTAENLDSEIFGLLKTVLGNKGKEALIKDFENELVKKGKMQKRFLSVLREVATIKQKVKSGKVSQTEMDNLRRDASELIRELIDYSQRKELIATEKGVIQVSFSDKTGELVLTDLGIFFIEAGRIMKVGKSRFDISNRKELEEAISETKDRVKLKLNSNVFEVLKKELGEFSLSV
ncbi:MAG: nucleotidyltransferase domain-containing protein [Nanoarchaeota archaeon]|nr:nucleotidyltransferase domain-containing protein [Nanoarchaeota archaeon]